MRLHQGKIDGAVRDFNAAEEFENVKYSTFLGRGKAYAHQELFDEALNECEKALRLDENVAEIHATQGQIYFQLKSIDKAVGKFSRAIELSSSNIDLGRYYYHRGAAYYEMHRLQRAVDDFGLAEKHQPNHAGTRIWKAAALARLEDLTGAIESLQAAITARPGAVKQYQALGRPVAEKAIKVFTDKLFDKPHQKDSDEETTQQSQNKSIQFDYQLYLHRGLAYQFLGEHQCAIDDYTSVIEMTKEGIKTTAEGISKTDATGVNDENEKRRNDALTFRGQMFAKQKKYTAAIEDYTIAIASDRANHVARYHRAIALIALRKFEKAGSDIEKITKLCPNHSRYHVLAGDIQQLHGGVSQAAMSYSRAITLDPSDAQALRKRGVVFLARGEFLKSIGDFTRSLELDPRQPDVIALRGTAHFKNGSLQSAREDYELALTHDDALVKAYCGRATVLAAQNQHEKSVIWLTKAFHRFESPRNLSELLITRGKIFYQMGRFLPSINDFSLVMDLQKGDRISQSAARYGRAIALVQQGELNKAKEDFEKVLTFDQNHRGAQAALNWMGSGTGARPANLQAPEQLIRPHRPPKQAKSRTLLEQAVSWDVKPPFNEWIVRHPEKSRSKSRKEYGPVSKSTLDQWAREGRILMESRILRLDWKKWRKATYVYPELAPKIEPKPKIKLGDSNSASEITSFPELNLNEKTENSEPALQNTAPQNSDED